MSPPLVIENLEVERGSFLLRIKNLKLNLGESIAILGSSGSGKTTFLDTLLGIIPNYKGSILLHGTELRTIPLEKRELGVIFQDFCLFPTMNVAQNICFGINKKRTNPLTLSSLAEKLGITSLLEQPIANLSGGEQQRVAIARALMTSYPIMLFDEPLNALDLKLRLSIRQFIKDQQKESQFSSLFITHDHEEAMSQADQILLFHQGEIIQQDSPWSIYTQPLSPYIMNFFGSTNILSGHYQSKDSEGQHRVQIGPCSMKGTLFNNDQTNPLKEKDSCQVYCRYTEVNVLPVLPNNSQGDEEYLSGDIVDEEFLGKIWNLKIRLNDVQYKQILTATVSARKGKQLLNQTDSGVLLKLNQIYISKDKTDY